jgi:hypothetical protein
MSDYEVATTLLSLAKLAESRGVPLANLSVPLSNRKKEDNFIDFFNQDCPIVGKGAFARTNQDNCRRLLADKYISINEMSGPMESEYSVTAKNALNEKIPPIAMIAHIQRHGSFLVPTLPEKKSLRQLLEMDVIPSFITRACKRGDFLDTAILEPNKWIAINMDKHEFYLGKIYNAQRNILVPGEYVPNIAEVLYVMSLCYLTRNKKLSFERNMVRTSTEVIYGCNASIGRFSASREDKQADITLSADILNKAESKDCGLAVGYCLDLKDKDKVLLT